MICALLIGRKNSKGFPKKNITKILGKYLIRKKEWIKVFGVLLGKEKEAWIFLKIFKKNI